MFKRFLNRSCIYSCGCVKEKSSLQNAFLSRSYSYKSQFSASSITGHIYGKDSYRCFSSLPEKGKQFFEKFLGNVVKADDNMEGLLDREKEANEAMKKAGLDDEDDEEEWVQMFNPKTGEWNGPRHGEPTTYGDWQSKGRATDFK